MALLDAITGNAFKTAGRNNAQAIGAGLTAGGDALTVGQNNALASLGTLGQGNALQALGAGYTQARGDIAAGYGAAQPALAQLGSAYAL